MFAAQQEAGQVVICNDNGQVVAALSQKKKKKNEASLDAIEIKAKAFESASSSLRDGSLSLKVII